MNMQMQMRRGLVALVIGLVLCGLAVARAHDGNVEAAHGVGAVIRAVERATDCDASLLIDLADVHVTVPCDLSCAPMRRMLRTLHVASTKQMRCATVQTA